ncbi:MAG: hypothetical protein Q7U63_06310 [Polaromonas sp.]|uniref:hypothetical protein n=1 Tax=Polaromonas sp. TaxID=1869339 RepID=UPI0027198DDC|nr:hypothetical protein [Polaromonas sp.]MDO9113394.1 hypothetical protein [Polaromonas sp.]MDP1887488.1 hypothetical protein [Polaromonas sp.]
MKALLPVRSWLMLWVRGAVCAVITLGTGSAMAQAAGPLLAAPQANFTSDTLGSLILSPSQRRNLETLRNTADNPDAGIQVLQKDPSIDLSPGLPDALVVSGVVVRSGNRSTVWVNDQPIYGRGAANPLRTLAGRAGVLQSGGHDMQLKARPGQVIDVPSGQAVDLLPPGAIRIIPPKAGVGVSIKKE